MLLEILDMDDEGYETWFLLGTSYKMLTPPDVSNAIECFFHARHKLGLIADSERNNEMNAVRKIQQ